jgi:hypothetical protein
VDWLFNGIIAVLRSSFGLPSAVKDSRIDAIRSEPVPTELALHRLATHRACPTNTAAKITLAKGLRATDDRLPKMRAPMPRDRAYATCTKKRQSHFV